MGFLVGLVAQDKGMNHYQSQEYDAAREYYESVLDKNDQNTQAQFGRGSSAFQQGDMATAKHAFEQALKSKDTALQSKAMYNLGNTFYKNEQTEEALAFYRKALELNPNDKDAKYNYEFLKYQAKPPDDQEQKQDDTKENQDENQDQEQEDKEDQKESQDKDEDKDQQDSKDQEEENKEKEDQPPKDQEQKQDEEQQDQQPQKPQPSDEQKSQDMKQAESILDALKQDEKIMQKQQIARSKSRKLAKDW